MSAYDIHESRLRPGDGCIDGEADGTDRWPSRDDPGDRSVATIASAMPSRLCESIAARPSWITAPSMLKLGLCATLGAAVGVGGQAERRWPAGLDGIFFITLV